jgi:hypothetical protein
MSITFYRQEPASHDVPISASSDESVAQLREVLAHAIALSGRDHWLWSPGALLSMHDERGTLVAVWRDQKALAKYHRYISQACDVLLGKQSDVEHCVDGNGRCVSVDYTPRRPPAADQAEGNADG